MDTSQLDALLFEDESTTLDFKRDQYPFENAKDEQKSELLKDILAFANAWRSSPAYILIGVDEVKGGRSKPVGVKTQLADANLQQFVNSKTNRKIDFRYECATIDGVEVGIICIPVQSRPSFIIGKGYGGLPAHTVYIRRGSSTDKADPEEIARMGEARATKRVDLTPRIVMEKCFLDLRFVWPHPARPNGLPAFLARKHGEDTEPSPPMFSIQNFGQSPARDVTIVFDLDDEHENLIVPGEWEASGLVVRRIPGLDGMGIPSLFYGHLGGGLPLYRRWTDEFPNLSPGTPRTVELPQGIANLLLLRGLQFGCVVRPGENRELTLWARVICHSMEEEKHTATFRWGVTPFSYKPAKPVIVYVNCRELPLRGGPVEPRVR